MGLRSVTIRVGLGPAGAVRPGGARRRSPRTATVAAALPVLNHVCLSTLICQSRQFMQFNYRIPANIELPPTQSWGVILMCVRRCPTFPPGLGSIIGAGRLSFRVRDGSGRFPAAIDRRNSIHLLKCPRLWCGRCVIGGGVWCRHCGCVVASLCVSFRPVSASSLNTLLCV